ncbi:MAG: sulfatase-like hydrolase/transferase [Verrucomicrobiales bacterium]|nr:sulfatase-like hydrolase/transferase [Verrucomicrobiales bacterium]
MKFRLFATVVACAATTVFSAAKPHVILVMADDQGWGDMAYNGHPLVKTPNFDEAAKSGLRFDRFYAAAPVCSPTRASVLTGRTPNRMGVFKWGYPMRPQETTLAEALKSAGYTTGHFGKWHLGSVRKTSPANPGNNGFDRWVSAPNYYDNDSPLSDEGTAIETKGESSIIAVDFALEWMEDALQKDAPIFSVIWFGSPHGPHRAAEEDAAHYADQPKNVQNFLGEITGMDRAFGKLRDKLEEWGIRENTILWYCSDNGALRNIGSTGGARAHKGSVYDGGLLVPSILEWPAKITKPNVIAETRCNTFDIYPTILEIAGVKVEKQAPLDGISLVPLIEGKPIENRRAMGFWDTIKPGIGTPSDRWMTELLEAQKAGNDLPPHPSSAKAAELPSNPAPLDSFPGHAAWIDGNWKLHRIQNKEGGVKLELYNLEQDPAEESDVAGEKKEVVSRMKTELDGWLKSVAASYNGADYE